MNVGWQKRFEDMHVGADSNKRDKSAEFDVEITMRKYYKEIFGGEEKGYNRFNRIPKSFSRLFIEVPGPVQPIQTSRLEKGITRNS
jgi:hypothetical protein